MKTWSWLVGLIIFSAGSFVNAKENKSFQSQVQAIIAKGDKDTSYTSAIADHLGFERGSPSRFVEMTPDETTDGLSHDFEVVFKDNKPQCVILRAGYAGPTQGVTYFYRVSISKRLEKAVEHSGRFDVEHKPIRGSGVITDLKLTPEVRKAYQHELDFWLKGLYRKPAAGAKAAATPLH